MTRVAHIMAGAPNGGAETFYERLIPALAARDDLLSIIRANAARAARLAPVVPLQLRFGGRLDLLTRPRLRAALRRFAPRTVIAWMGRAAHHTPSGPFVLIGRLGGTYTLSQFAHCDHLVGNTPGIVAWLRAQGWPAARTHLLPNFSPDLAGAAPAELLVPPGVPLILAMGRLHKVKGFDVLLAALTHLPRAHAAIAGEGEERANLETLASRAGLRDRVHFLGWRTDTAALLARASVLAVPSRAEPLGNVVLEAFAARVPVVATTTEGPSWLLEGGTRGILVPPDSGIALASALGALLDNPDMAARMAEAARAHWEAHFRPEAVTKTWRDFCATVEKAR